MFVIIILLKEGFNNKGDRIKDVFYIKYVWYFEKFIELFLFFSKILLGISFFVRILEFVGTVGYRRILSDAGFRILVSR